MDADRVSGEAPQPTPQDRSTSAESYALAAMRCPDPGGCEICRTLAAEVVAKLRAGGFTVTRLEQVGWVWQWGEAGHWTFAAGGPCNSDEVPVYRIVEDLG